MKRYPILALALAIAVAMVAGCTPPAPATEPVATDVATLSIEPTSVPVTTTPLPAPVMVRIYLDRAERMQPVLRPVPGGMKAVLKAALTALLEGPSATESASELHTLIPSGTTLNDVSISGKTATVDLSHDFESGGGTLSMTNRLAQVVFTATQFPTVTSVRFELDGKPVTVFGGEGIVLDHPSKRSDFEGATPAIFVDDPAWQGTIRNGAAAGGTANVFEGVFRLQIRDTTGSLVVDKTVQSTSGTGTRGTWVQKLTWGTATPGAGVLKVFAASPKDGKPIEVLTVPVTIAD